MIITYGFELVKERDIPELNTVAKLYRHLKTGAQVLSLENDDENKVFGVSFRTPPDDSTGLPHIMEHSVLCGSRKFPVKEPFMELVKGSLNTFVNAFTYPDKTCYPVASQNLQDFYNLVDVYLDAVFFPNLTPEILQQEGWHYELEGPGDPLTYKGVVFNEMKGVYSSPDSLIGRFSECELFPDNIYRHDSGGDPEAIPDLTFEQFMNFHKTYYHPSNARIFFYGDDDPTARLKLLTEYLNKFSGIKLKNQVALQSKRSHPWRVTHTYPAGEDAEQQKTMLTVNWLLPENNDPVLALGLTVLSHILVGKAASPLHKALIDSGLGEDVIGGGLDDSLRQLYFSTGLKGVESGNINKAEALILDTLAKLARDGIDKDTIAASMNTVEFSLREQNYGHWPRGLIVMFNALTTWLHDGDPFAAIAFERPLNAIKRQLSQNPHYFETLIQQHLVINHHRVTVVLEPDAELQRRKDSLELARLDAIRADMAASDIDVVMASVARLRERQETPDSPEALATIPTLTLDDLDKQPRAVDTTVTKMHDTVVLHNDLFTNGIVYLDVGFDLHTLPEELLPFAQLFGDALLEIGTKQEDYVKLTQRIGQKTGGIAPSLFYSPERETGDAIARLFLRGKSTMEQVPDLLSILRDIILNVNLDNRERLTQMLLERKAREEASLVPAGHRVVATRLRARLHPGYWVAEQTTGLEYLFFLRKLIVDVEKDWARVLAMLESVRNALINRSTMLVNVTLDKDNWKAIRPKVDTFLAALPDAKPIKASWSCVMEAKPEGLVVPANVNYVGKGANLYELGYTPHGSIEVVTHYLRSTWLWEQVRIKGGAYGAFCLFDQHSGVYATLSYRDPNLVNTLNAYDGSSEFLKTLALSNEELVKGIIGAIGTLDAYQLPDAKGYSAMARHLVGYSDQERQLYRDQVLGTQISDFHAFGETLEAVNAAGQTMVLGSKDAIEAANASLQPPFTLKQII